MLAAVKVTVDLKRGGHSRPKRVSGGYFR